MVFGVPVGVFGCDTGSIIAIQALDGVGAGLQGALFPIMVADLTRGSGRFNIALGLATMIQGIGAAVSTTLAGAIIVVGGYTTAMGALTAIAILALVLLVIGVPETAHRGDGSSGPSLDPPADPHHEPVPA
jgi:MFS family permease